MHAVPGRSRARWNPNCPATASNPYAYLGTLPVKIFLVVLAAVVVATLAAVGMLGMHRSEPVGEATRETRAVSGFNRISISGLADVELRQGSTEGVTIDAPASLQRRIRTEVRDHTLVISMSRQRNWFDWSQWAHRTHSPRVTIDLIQLERLESSGATKIVADKLRADNLRLEFAGACTLRIADLQAGKLVLAGSGAIKAQLAGKVTEQSIELSGAGSYDAANLISDKVAVQVSGAGKAIVNAASSLSVELSGAGLVEYLGDPKIKQEVSGIGKIRRRDV